MRCDHDMEVGYELAPSWIPDSVLSAAKRQRLLRDVAVRGGVRRGEWMLLGHCRGG